jgi:hypothetical protein
MEFTLSGFAARMMGAAAALHEGNRAAMEAAAVIIEKRAKATFGSGELVPNAAATVAIKGFDSPGIETGATRDSIQHNSDAHEAYIGSNDIKMVWLEHGTHKTGGAWGIDNPPRPILGVASVSAAPEAVEAIGREVMAALTAALDGATIDGLETLKEAAHLVRRASEDLYEIAHPEYEPDE